MAPSLSQALALSPSLSRRLRRFAADEGAAVSIEAAIILPALVFFYISAFIFFDAFRVYTTSVKATYAVADVLSRQTSFVFASDIEGLNAVFRHLTRNRDGSDMRVSQVHRATDGLEVEWSYATGAQTILRDRDLPAIDGRIPDMALGERVLVVETRLPYRPIFDVGISEQLFENFTVTRPRFAGQIPWGG